MIAESQPKTQTEASAAVDSPAVAPSGTLEITLDCTDLPVSYLSSLLRVMQAALRVVGRNREASRQAFSQQPQPVLLLSADTSGGDMVMRFAFADPFDSTPLDELSRRVFGAFLEQFSAFLKGLPQRGLWGASAAGSRKQRHESETARRMDQMRVELRRFSRVSLRFDGHSILIEGDRMEIE